MAKKPLKEFEGTIQFDAVTIRVKAANKTTARKKIMAKVANLKPTKILDRKNTFVEETGR